MEKTIKIGDKDVRLNNNIGWAMEYRDQFGHDIVPAIMPALWGILNVAGELMQRTDKNGKISQEAALELFETDSFTDAMIKLSGLEFVDFINITWSLAKCADGSIPEPREWVRGFDEFPLDVIAPEVFRLILAGVMSSKNAERLRETIQNLKPETEQQ